MQEDAITLFELTSRIGNSIHSSPELRSVWIIAELSDVAVRGGHFYADLIQKNDAGQTIARMRANLWARTFGILRSKYLAERGEDLKNGIKVKIQGSATHHNMYGLSFNILDIDPSYVDEGDILRRRMEILDRMKKEGVFDDNHKLELPADLQRIAVISAQGAAGLGDFLNQLKNSTEGFRFRVKLFESPMQGDRAAIGVMAALELIADETDLWDCVVIIRGGGATSDMNCFDNESLARHICMFPLPVIVGIGHERDNCVLDYIANTRCKTPTAVAEFLINHQRQAWQSVCSKVNEIIRFVNLYIDGEKQRLTQVETFIPAAICQFLEREKLRLKGFTSSIPLASGSLTSREHTRLEAFRTQLSLAVKNTVASHNQRLLSTEKILSVLSPENTLRRGYSITRCGSKAVRDAASVPAGSVIETRLSSGSISSTVL